MGDHTAFNKWNPTELLSQLIAALHKHGLREIAQKITDKNIPTLVTEAWLAKKGITKDEARRRGMRLAMGTDELLKRTIRVAHANERLRPHLLAVLRKYAGKGKGKKWIPEDLEKGRCTPGEPNYDCPKGSPQYNLAQTFKKHPEWGEKGGKAQKGKKKDKD